MDTLHNNGDEILTAFARTEGARLADWMRLYPAHARELARFAADRWTAEGPDAADAASLTAVARVRQIGLSALRERRAAASAAAAAQNAVTFSSLVAAVEAKGMDAETAALRLQVPYALFFKLHRRLLAPESVPASFVRSLSETIGRTVDEVNAYLRMPPTLAAGASYRADDTPTVGDREDFASALRSDPEATDAQVARWLNAG